MTIKKDTARPAQLYWPRLRINTRRAAYPIIRRTAKRLNWKICRKNVDMAWLDVWSADDLQRITHKINHFSGMHQICAKCSLGRHLTRMQRVCPEHFGFFPTSFELPADRAALSMFLDKFNQEQQYPKIKVKNSARKSIRKSKRSSKSRSLRRTHSLHSSRQHPLRPAVVTAPSPASASEYTSWTTSDNEDDLVSPNAATSTSSEEVGAYANTVPSTTPTARHSDTDDTQSIPQTKKGIAFNRIHNHSSRSAGRRQLVMIAKPDVSCQGRGIRLITEPRKLLRSDFDLGGFTTITETIDRPRSVLVQRYVDDPVLVGGHKFDLRLYVCVTSVQPELRVFLLQEGLTRFATQKYERPTRQNAKHRMMHLTNYAVNKGRTLQLSLDDTESPDPNASVAYLENKPEPISSEHSLQEESDNNDHEDQSNDQSEDEDASSTHSNISEGHNLDPFTHFRHHAVLSQAESSGSGGPKWSFSATLHVLKEQGIDVDKLWSDICDLVAKTVAVIAPSLQHQYTAATSGVEFSNSSSNQDKKRNQNSNSHAQKTIDGGFMCFELLGFDILLAYTRDENTGENKITPQLLEVNQSPSFHCDSELDKVIKSIAIGDALRLASPSREWLRNRFPTIARRIDPRYPLNSKANLSELRRDYENLVCCGKIDQTDDELVSRISRYETKAQFVRLLPSPDPLLETKYSSLMELARSSSGSLLQGTSAAFEKRRAEAIARRKRLEGSDEPKSREHTRSHTKPRSRRELPRNTNVRTYVQSSTRTKKKLNEKSIASDIPESRVCKTSNSRLSCRRTQSEHQLLPKQRATTYSNSNGHSTAVSLKETVVTTSFPASRPVSAAVTKYRTLPKMKTTLTSSVVDLNDEFCSSRVLKSYDQHDIPPLHKLPISRIGKPPRHGVTRPSDSEDEPSVSARIQSSNYIQRFTYRSVASSDTANTSRSLWGDPEQEVIGLPEVSCASVISNRPRGITRQGFVIQGKSI